MKKVFVLYSLRQKLAPSIYKTKSIVTKHVNTNKALLYQQFDSEEQAKIFIQKFSIQSKNINSNNVNKQLPLISQEQVKQLVENIVGKGEKGKVKKGQMKSRKVSERDKVVQQQQQLKNELMSRQGEWTILPNGHAFRKNNINASAREIMMDEQKYDSSYSTLNKNTHQSQSTPSSNTTETQSESQQLLSSLTTEQQTTEGLTQQSSFNNNKLNYWVVSNKLNSQIIKMGKKKTQLGLLLYQLENKHSQQWAKQNIQVKRFKTSKQAFLYVDQLKKQKQTILNRMKAERIRENIKVSSMNNNIQQEIREQQQEEAITEVEAEKQTKHQKKVEQQQILLNYDEILDLSQEVTSSNNKVDTSIENGERRQRKNIEQENEKILWAGHLIKQSISIQQSQEITEVNNINSNGNVDVNELDNANLVDNAIDNNSNDTIAQPVNIMKSIDSSINMMQLGPYVEQQQLIIGVTTQHKEQSTTQQSIISSQSTIITTEQISVVNQQQPTPINQERQQQSYVDKQFTKQQQIEQLTQSKQQLQNIVNHYQMMQNIENNIMVGEHIQSQQPINEIQLQQQLSINKQCERQKYLQDQIHEKQQKLEEQRLRHQQQQQVNQQQQKYKINDEKIKQSNLSSTIISPQSTTLTTTFQSQTIQSSLKIKTTFKPHPYNKRHIKHLILDKFLRYQQHQQHSLQQQQQQPEYQQQQQQVEYIIYPSLVIKQSPGFAIGSYQIKQSRTNKLIKKESITLGQCKSQQANLLSLAFTLCSTYNFHNKNKSNSKRLKLHLNKQMQKSLSYNYKLDKQLIQTQQFIKQIEQKCNGRLQYIL